MPPTLREGRSSHRASRDPVLVVDDEPQIRRALRTSLEAHGYEVRTAVERARRRSSRRPSSGPTCVLLDLGLPDLDGTEVIRRVRPFSDVPIIVLSVRDGQADKVAALDAGADDYVTKPFGMEELLARVARGAPARPGRSARRPRPRGSATLEVDLVRRLVTLDGEQVHLTPTEYALLEALVTNPGKLLTHQWLLRRVWGQGYANETTYLRMYVRTLRRSSATTRPRPG